MRSHSRPPQFRAGQRPHGQHRIFMCGHIGVADRIPGTDIGSHTRVLYPFHMDCSGRAKTGRRAAGRTRKVGFVSYWVSTPISLSLSVPFDPALKSAAGFAERPLTLEYSGIWAENSYAVDAPPRLLVQPVPQRPWLPAVPARRKPRRPGG